jgi:ABC-type lipoprotein export system ATPase subunit
LVGASFSSRSPRPAGGIEDSKTGTVIVQLLQSLRDEKRTVLIATHDDAIAKEADFVMEMRDGRLIDDASQPQTAQR